MNLIFIHGLPGVGKLTVATELSRLTGYRLFHNHLTVDLLTSVFEFGSEPFIDLRESIWLSVFERAAEEQTPGLIFTFVFEKTVRDSFIGEMLEALETRGGKVLFVRLQCEQSTLETRIANPDRANFGKLNSLDTFKELDADGVFDLPALPQPELIIDNTALSPLEAAGLICERLGLGEV